MSTVLDYRLIDRDIALLSFEMHTSHMYEHKAFAPDRKYLRILLDRNEDLMRRVMNPPPFDPVSEIFHERFVDVLNDQKDRLEHIASHPADLLYGNAYRIGHLARLDKRSDERRIELSVERLKMYRDILNSITDLLKDCPEASGEVKAAIAYTIEQLQLCSEDTDSDYPGLDDAVKQKLMNAFMETEDKLKNYADALEDTKKASDPLRADPERYREILWTQHGVDLDELIRDHEADITETRNRVFSLVDQLPIPEEEKEHSMRNVSALLNKYAGPASTAEEMFGRIQDYLARGRKAAHEYVNLPEDETCRCHTIPRTLKDTFPWGGYEGGDETRRPVTGQMFLNNYNVSAVTDGWMKINAIHECYPGHHVQYVRRTIDRTPECLKMDARNIPLIEGTSIRTETVFAYIYDDDPFYPVFAAYRRHHASVRIKVDLMLYIERKTAEECAEVYMEELGFDPETAMGQVRAQLSRPGYFTCYHYGLKKILQWEKETGMSVKNYTELLFRAGDISITSFRKYLSLTPEQRYSYSHDYASMLRDFRDLPDLCTDLV